MSGSKHSVYRSRILAVIFLFLNAVCVASPVIRNTPDDYKQLISLPFGHDCNTFESEENQLPSLSLISQQTQSSVTTKKHNNHGYTNYYSPLRPGKQLSNSLLIASDFLPQPGYYANLFLYKLF